MINGSRSRDTIDHVEILEYITEKSTIHKLFAFLLRPATTESSSINNHMLKVYFSLLLLLLLLQDMVQFAQEVIGLFVEGIHDLVGCFDFL
jgi:hypothetical protein